MSMTTVNAKIYISRIIGGANSQQPIDLAGEALLRGYQDWQTAKLWRFLLRDTTSYTPSVTGCTATATSATVNAPSTGAFDFVNIGQTVTTTGSATLAADTVVSSYTRNSDGTIATITLSNAFGGSTNTNATLTFSANIPIKVGVNDYNLPLDFYAPFTARLITNLKRPLVWKDHRFWDRVIWDQSITGTPSEYTTYNPYSELTQNFGTQHLKFDRTPSADDTILLKYYRKFNTSGTNVDMPDELLYKFLDYCRSIVLDLKRAQDDPNAYREGAVDSFHQAQEGDEEPTDDNDDDMRMKSQYEMGDWNRPLWGNGPFDPYNNY